MKGLAIGARVLIRDEVWLVQQLHHTENEGHVLHCLGVSDLVRDFRAVFFSRLERQIHVLEPETTRLVRDDTPRYRRSRLWLDALHRRLPPTDDRIHLAHRAALDPMDWQLEPARKALGNLRPSLLIADGVGLGKTLEVGMLLTELIRRGRGERILVVAIRSMLAQFQQELWQRFSIPLVRLDSRGIERVRARIPASRNPFHQFPRAILSIDTLKNDGRYRRFLEHAEWDAVVIDECHNVAGAGTQRNRLARLLARRTESLILTSATPHNGSAASFAALIDMLDPTAIADPNRYDATDIAHLFVRRFKKDVVDVAGSGFQERDPHLVRARASLEEEEALRAIQALDADALRSAHRDGGPLFRTTLLKAALSSPHAALETVDQRLRQLERSSPEGDAPDPRAAARAALEDLRPRLERAIPTFAKLDTLRATLGRIGFDGRKDAPRVLLFSERIATLEAVRRFLHTEMHVPNAAMAVFTARLPDIEQQRIVEEFGRADSPLRILLATDVASEGVNLHYNCHHLIHFDIPWSIIRLEQRNGRIDRYGQTHPPDLTFLVTQAQDPGLQADLRILDRLIDKERWVHKNLGDPARLLELYDPDAEEAAILAGVAEGRPIEEILPDAPSTLSFEDLLRSIGVSSTAEPTRKDSPPAASTAPESPFHNDLDFARLAFEELANDPIMTGVVPPEIDAERGILELVAPPDLRRRFDNLPAEAIPPDWRFRLTTDRQRVSRAINAQRLEQGNTVEASARSWTPTQLLWDQHPAFLWLTERIVARLERNQAPVLRVGPLPATAPEDTRAAQALFLFTGVTANQAGQAVLSRWMAVPLTFRPPAVCGPIASLEDILAWTGLHRDPVNRPVDDETLERAETLRGLAARAATDHMRALRVQRGQEILPRLQKANQALKAWAAERRALADADLERADQLQGGASARLRQAANERRAEADRMEADQKTWIQRRLTTDDAVHLQLTAVLLPDPAG